MYLQARSFWKKLAWVNVGERTTSTPAFVPRSMKRLNEATWVSHHRLAVRVVLHALPPDARIGPAPDAGDMRASSDATLFLFVSGPMISDSVPGVWPGVMYSSDRHATERDSLTIGDDHVPPRLEFGR